MPAYKLQCFLLVFKIEYVKPEVVDLNGYTVHPASKGPSFLLAE